MPWLATKPLLFLWRNPSCRIREECFREQFHTGLVAITSFTGFLSSMLLWIFVFSGLVAFVAIFNAIR